MMGCIIAFPINHIFFTDNVIGDDTNYTLFVFLLPTVVGFFLSMKYFVFNEIWANVHPKIVEEKNILKRIGFFLVITFCNFLYAYFIFGIPAHIIWTNLNREVSKQSPIEYHTFDVEKFHKRSGRGSSNAVYVEFQNGSDKIIVSREFVEQFLSENPKDYKINVSLRKGLWNEYVVENYDVEKKNK